MSSDSQPKKPLTLYTGITPNGHQVSVYLEELKARYPNTVDYNVFSIIVTTLVQKEPWFIKLNPNGRIPVLVDHSRNDFVVFESSAILLYLAHHHDKDHVFWFDAQKEPDAYSELLQWMFFTHGGLAPMQGQAGHFVTFSDVDIPYAKKRYTEEVRRLFGVLEIRLKGRDYLAGSGKGKYTLADMKAFPWVRLHEYTGVDDLGSWPAVKEWLALCDARPAGQIGLDVGASPHATLYLNY